MTAAGCDSSGWRKKGWTGGEFDRECSFLRRVSIVFLTVGHDTVLDGVLEREDTALGLGLVTDVGVLLAHADHHAFVARAADNRREHGAGSIISSETGLEKERRDEVGTVERKECIRTDDGDE